MEPPVPQRERWIHGVSRSARRRRTEHHQHAEERVMEEIKQEGEKEDQREEKREREETLEDGELSEKRCFQRIEVDLLPV